MTAELRLLLDNQDTALQQIDEAVEDFGVEQDWPPALLFQVRLVLEELAVNVISYGFESGGNMFEVVLRSTPDRLVIKCTDDSWPFNPLTDSSVPDVEAALEDRNVGGLGIHLVRTMMDELEYQRKDGKNCLTLVKRRDE